MSVDMNKVLDLTGTKEVIDTKDACIAPVESTSTASQAYAVGQRFWYAGKLYIATADIASGGTITPNTNCKLDVLGDDLTSQSEKITELNTAITLKTDDLYNILEAYQSVFQKGFWASETGIYNGTRSDYVCTKNPIPVKEGDVITVSNIPQTSGYCFFMRYAPDMSYINGTQTIISEAGTARYTVPSGVGFIHLDITKGGATINPLDYTNIVTVSINNARSRKFESIENLLKWDCSDYFRSKFVTHMSHNGNGTYGSNTARNAITSPLHFDSDIKVTVGSGLKIAYQIYDGYTTGSTHLVTSSAWITTSTMIKAGTYWCMIVAYTSEADTTDTTQNGLTFEMNLTADDVYAKLLGEDYDIGKTFVIGTDLVKRKLSTTKIGSLKYYQSFCMYNGKYYSTDGSNIGVQDSSFADVSTVELSVGHGNNFQLGNNGKAYISGWNDNKVYVIDMETLTIDSTINLGTTGYTTAVIDDLNKIAYIFQRDSYPDTVVNYNFIVYDYQNQQVKSTKVINAFGALQSVDFYNGKIIALWGLGVQSVTSGMATYDTSGNILAEYYLDVIRKTEPEGVFIDRAYGDLLISIVDKSVYKITV